MKADIDLGSRRLLGLGVLPLASTCGRRRRGGNSLRQQPSEPGASSGEPSRMFAARLTSAGVLRTRAESSSMYPTFVCGS